MEWDVDIKPTESIYEVLECVCGDNKIPPEVKHTFKATTEREASDELKKWGLSAINMSTQVLGETTEDASLKHILSSDTDVCVFFWRKHMYYYKKQGCGNDRK